MNKIFIICAALTCLGLANCYNIKSGDLEECPVNQWYDECNSHCQKTCDDWDNGEVCPPVCIAGCRCVAGLVLDKNGNCIPISECPAKTENCPINEEYDECCSACPTTCDNMDEHNTTCPPVCIEGCRCIDGYVLDKNKICVKKSECPAKPKE